jgi:hypothetical protein
MASVVRFPNDETPVHAGAESASAPQLQNIVTADACRPRLCLDPAMTESRPS